MTGGLSVGVGAAVVTDELDWLASVLHAAAQQCHEILRRIPPLRTGDSPGRDADLAEIHASLAESGERLGSLARALRNASALYAATERTRTHAIETVGAQLAAAAGLLLSRLGVVLLPSLLAVASRAALLWQLIPSDLRESALQAAAPVLERALPVLSEPALLEALRVMLSAADDAALGVAGVPPILAGGLGETGLGVSGIDSAALAVLGLAALAGASGIDPVRIDRVGSDRLPPHRARSEPHRGGQSGPVEPPGSLADRVGRIPDPATPIVIERYSMPQGVDHVEVYIAGTDAQAPMGGDRPWDMASNVALIAGEQASSLQAVRAALAAEGVTSDMSVTFTGYSQGGAIATVLAESGDYRTAGLVTVGAPSGGLPVTGGYPAIVIEHRDDLVPVLSGIRRETTAVVVRGDALTDLDGTSAARPHGALPGHDFERYQRTTAQADAFDNVTLRAAIDALPQPGGRGERSAYTATRTPSGS